MFEHPYTKESHLEHQHYLAGIETVLKMEGFTRKPDRLIVTKLLEHLSSRKQIVELGIDFFNYTNREELGVGFTYKGDEILPVVPNQAT